MPAWIAIAAGAQIAGALFGSSASRGAAKDAEALGRANADFIKQETEEQARRLKFEQGRTRSSVNLRFAGSGFRSGEG